MSKHARDNRPYIRPVTRIELSEQNIKLRWILIVVLLSIAVVSIVTGLTAMLETEPGWQTISSNSTRRNCGSDFVLMYACGSDSGDATADYRSVTNLYTRLTEQAYDLFTADAAGETANLYTLNTSINQSVTLPGELYAALELLVDSGCRDPFLAPVVQQMNSLLLAQNDGEAGLYDPYCLEEEIAYREALMEFIRDPAMIRLELLGENRAQLTVAPEYAAFAEEYGIETLFDLGWMKNAFLADYLAKALADSGFTNGYLVSYDGFTRNLDEGGNVYTANVFDRLDNTIAIPAALHYEAPAALVSLRNYPLSEEDRWHYYAYQDGTIRSVYLDIRDGVSRSSTDNLLCYGENVGCAQILLACAPVFLTEQLEEEKLLQLEQQGIHSIWGEGSVLRYTEQTANLELLTDSGGSDYRLEFVQ